MKGQNWVNFILGLWLIVTPFALHYGDITVATWNNVIIGILPYTGLWKSSIWSRCTSSIVLTETGEACGVTVGRLRRVGAESPADPAIARNQIRRSC
jgi:hypothetical protein